MHTRVNAASVAYVDVVIVARKIDELRRRRYLEIDFGMLFQEALHPRNEPLDHERGRHINLESLRLTTRMQVARCLGQLLERLLDRRQVVTPRLGQHERVALSVEELDAEALFERLDLVAHCRRRDK